MDSNGSRNNLHGNAMPKETRNLTGESIEYSAWSPQAPGLCTGTYQRYKTRKSL